MRHAIFPALLLAITAWALGQAPPGAFKQPDGHWWENASYRQQGAFLNGWDICSSFLLHQPGPNGINYDQIQQRVTSFYERSGADLRKPVTSVISDFYSKWKRSGKYRFTHGNPSDSPGGNYWRGDSGGFNEAFIEGFRACQAAAGMPVSTAPANQLNAWVERWYGTSASDPSIESLPHGDKPLAAVIPMAEHAFPGPRAVPPPKKHPTHGTDRFEPANVGQSDLWLRSPHAASTDTLNNPSAH